MSRLREHPFPSNALPLWLGAAEVIDGWRYIRHGAWRSCTLVGVVFSVLAQCATEIAEQWGFDDGGHAAEHAVRELESKFAEHCCLLVCSCFACYQTCWVTNAKGNVSQWPPHMPRLKPERSPCVKQLLAAAGTGDMADVLCAVLCVSSYTVP